MTTEKSEIFDDGTHCAATRVKRLNTLRSLQTMSCLGAMSGTSMDGVDLALIETDGETVSRFGPACFYSYSDEDRALLRAAIARAASLSERATRPDVLAQAEHLLTLRHIQAIQNFIETTQKPRIDLIGFHGQTVLHRPECALTIQLGDGAFLARQTHIPVVYDFRAADMAAGGQGAPLVPAYHQALARGSQIDGNTKRDPLAIINIGGVANITYMREGCDPVACDVGPGNALLDDLMLAATGLAMDRDGATAARGVVNTQALAMLLAHPYFDQAPPKSLDRNAFSAAAVKGMALADAAATLTAFTAASIAQFFQHVADPPQLAVICGGGARNPTLLRMLSKKMGCPVKTADALGWSVDFMEAQAFAFLAVRSIKALPLTFPTTTGAPRAITGGVVA